MRNLKGWLAWPWMRTPKRKANTPRLKGFVDQITRELDRLRDSHQPLVVSVTMPNYEVAVRVGEYFERTVNNVVLVDMEAEFAKDQTSVDWGWHWSDFFVLGELPTTLVIIGADKMDFESEMQSDAAKTFFYNGQGNSTILIDVEL